MLIFEWEGRFIISLSKTIETTGQAPRECFVSPVFSNVLIIYKTGQTLDRKNKPARILNRAGSFI